MHLSQSNNDLSVNQLINKQKKKADPFQIQPLPEPIAGLEPATHALRMRCSTN